MAERLNLSVDDGIGDLLSELAGGELARSTRAGGVVGELLLVMRFGHVLCLSMRTWYL